MTAQLIDIAGHKMVLLPEADYLRLCEIAEENADIQVAAIAEERHRQGEEYVPSHVIDQLLDGEPPLRVWRKFRGLTQQALADRVGLSKMSISGIERGIRDTGLATWRRLAEVLEVDISDLMVATDGEA